MYPDLPPKGVYTFFIYDAADGISKSDDYYINLHLRSEKWRDGQEPLVTVVCMTHGPAAQIGNRILTELGFSEEFVEEGEEYVRYLEPEEMRGVCGAVKIGHRLDDFKGHDISCNEISTPYFGQCGIMSEHSYNEYLSQNEIKDRGKNISDEDLFEPPKTEKEIKEEEANKEAEDAALFDAM